MSPPPLAAAAARLFFPQSKSLGIDLGGLSPGILKKAVYAGSNAPAFKRAAKDLLVLAEVHIPAKQVERLTRRVGQERQQERDAATAAYLARPLARREDLPAGVSAPDVAVVEADGGRIQIRPQGERAEQTNQPDSPLAASSRPPSNPPGPAAEVSAAEVSAEAALTSAAVAGSTAEQGQAEEQAGRPGKGRHWREDKVGCLLQMSSTPSQLDPCPEIPDTFVNPLRALTLAKEIGGCAVPQGAPFQQAKPEAEQGEEEPAGERPGKPKVEQRRVVASRKDVHLFGPLLAAAAWAMGLFGAPRRAFVADGSSTNWSIWRRYFPRWVGVLDFVHALSYVYAAAMAGRSFKEGWGVYERWIRWVWGGQVRSVIEELSERQKELGEATEQDKEGSPRRVVQDALTYLSNNQDKMNYPEYRKAGLPLMSSHVESTIKQINYRVKGTEKFWSEEGAEAILQLRADYLSDDEPMEDFWQRRQDNATGQRPYRRSA